MLYFSETIAQITTGGGIVIPPYAVTVPVSQKIFEKKLKSYIQHIKKRESLCHYNQKIIVHDDLLKIYMGLSIESLSTRNKEDCFARNQVLACINDKNTKKIFQALNKNDSLKKYLKFKYKINDNYADEMIQFFGEMGTQKGQ